MPNWCYSKFTFTSDNTQELKRLYNNFQIISSISCPKKTILVALGLKI